MRIKNTTRPTYIYWLIDMRPEIIAAGWHSGYPFYCGKTVKSVAKRFAQHKYAAQHAPVGQISERLHLCGEHIRVETMEIIPAGQNWVEREKHWIKILRFSFPDNCNVSAGGSGSPGYSPTPEVRAKQSAALTGRQLSPEHVAKMRERRHTDGAKEKIRNSLLGVKHTDERRRNISLAVKGKKQKPRSPEHCARIAENKRQWWAARKAAEAQHV